MTAREAIRTYLETRGWRTFDDIYAATLGYARSTVRQILREPWIEDVYDCGTRLYRIRKDEAGVQQGDSST